MYVRVIPRDLFNEANLLKCLGKLWTELEKLNLVFVKMDTDGAPFDVRSSMDDGSTHVQNVWLVIHETEYHLWRPLNSRDAWPLKLDTYESLDTEDPATISVFDDEGNLSEEMLEFLKDNDI